jgi:hypothetical protein
LLALLDAGSLQSAHRPDRDMSISMLGRLGWAILFFLVPCKPLVNAWFLSTPVRRIIPYHIVPSALIRLRTKQQWDRRRRICYVKADDETPASVTAMKVRAMASFLSMAMIESLLASGVSIETILGGVTDISKTSDAEIAALNESPLENEIPTREHQKEGDRKFALKDEFSPLTTSDAQLEKEVSTTLHRKEGDRNVALKDGFAPEEPDQFSSLPTAEITTMSESDGIDNVSAIEDISQTTTPETDVDAAPLSPFSLRADTPHLIPPVPPAISTAFGRPLPVIRDHVPPLQQPPELTTASSLSSANTVVADEDPYGE